MRWQKPLPLHTGCVVRVLAPSGPFDRESFERGLDRLDGHYAARVDESVFARARYLAGTDAVRGQALSDALVEPDVRALFAARGGYGAMRLLPSIDPGRGPPRALVGFSDITALHALWQSRGFVSFHAPVLTQFGRLPPEAFERLRRMLEFTDEPAGPLDAEETFVEGVAEGRLIGGNLAVFSRLLGTPYLPPLEGNVLLLEDVGERPYRLDRMWTHLALAGVFTKLRGIVLGDFTGCEEKDADYTSRDLLRELAQETKLPCAFGFPIGHGPRNEAVPLGVRVRLDATERRLTFLEAAVSEEGTT